MIVALLGPSADLERCERAADGLIAAGITIAYNWPETVRERRNAGLTDADLNGFERAGILSECLDAIDNCDLVWWLCGDSIGAAFEAGYAYGSHSEREFVCSGTPHAIYRPGSHFATDAEALTWIARVR